MHGQGIANTYDIFPPPTEAPAVEEHNVPVEEQSNENFDKGNVELLNPVKAGDCLCVPYYLCNDDNTLNTDGTGIIDIRFVLLLLNTITGDKILSQYWVVYYSNVM